jgi:hypothetical protein
MNYNIPLKDHFVERIVNFRLARDVFLKLGNTGVAAQRNHFASVTATATMPRHFDPSGEIQKLDVEHYLKVMELRHPDPQLAPTFTIQDDALHVRGSWQKIKLARGIKSRMGFASFVYNGNHSRRG